MSSKGELLLSECRQKFLTPPPLLWWVVAVFLL